MTYSTRWGSVPSVVVLDTVGYTGGSLGFASYTRGRHRRRASVPWRVLEAQGGNCSWARDIHLSNRR